AYLHRSDRALCSRAWLRRHGGQGRDGGLLCRDDARRARRQLTELRQRHFSYERSRRPDLCCQIIGSQRAIERGICPERSAMTINKVLIAAVLAAAIAAPIVAVVGDINMAQPTTPTGERAAFFHGPGNGPIANQSGLASLERADAWLNSPTLTA